MDYKYLVQDLIENEPLLLCQGVTQMNVNEISKLENGFEKFMTVYEKNPADIVLYGAGAGADWAIRLLETKNILPAAIADSSTIQGGA